MSNYLMGGQITELERLRLQSQTLEPDTIAFLSQLGIQPGWNVLEIACGAMGALAPLARLVGSTGKVVGTDIDQKLIDAARAYLVEQGLSNAPIDLVIDDIYNTKLPEHSFDLTHVRFLIAPVGREDVLIPQLFRVTKPGGIVVSQEPDTTSWNVYPRSQSFDQLLMLVREAFKQSGGNLDIGRRLYRIWSEAGLRNIGMHAFIVALPPKRRYLRGLMLLANSLRPRILAAKLISEPDLNALIAEVERHVANPEVAGVTFTVIQVWGTVP